MNSGPGLGAPMSGVAAGNRTDKDANVQGNAGMPADQAMPGNSQRSQGGSPGTVGGVAGPVGTATGGGQASGVASGQIATSPEDVRRQSEGKPTTAAAAQGDASSASTSSDDRRSQAKMALQRAVDLNAKGDKSCMSAVQDAQNLMQAK